ncbi:MAG: hypothetical protein JWM76_1841 [Pseudonocardiales bacterium]|nr:hypothetical protein [Pseudonocardiales bacterium]
MPTNSARNTPTYITALVALLGIALIVAGIIYFAEPAGSLPSFFPGHQTGSAHHHTTHGIAALIIGLIALAGAWMSMGKTSVE